MVNVSGREGGVAVNRVCCYIGLDNWSEHTSTTMTEPKPMNKRMDEYVRDLQNRIVGALEALDPNAPPFKRDSWVSPHSSTTRSSITRHRLALDAALAYPVYSLTPPDNFATPQPILEKAGVNISIVHGQLPPSAIAQMRANHDGIPYDPQSGASLGYFAASISLVIHPRNPPCPNSTCKLQVLRANRCCWGGFR